MSRLTLCSSLLVTLAVRLAAPAQPTSSPEGVAFFENKVRPVLVENCYSCHSAASGKQKGGLALDTRAGVRKGGENGPALVPGRPEESLLVKAVRHTGEGLRMPPKARLPDAAVADLERWVRMGAPDPREEPATNAGPMDFEAARRHWAYRPVRRPVPPAVTRSDWPASPVDVFVLARLEASGLTPSPAADRRTLLRRITYDLLGLPPTAAEVEAFEKDVSPGAFAKVVDRLLASPHYGERWGRHWLDVARFADTKDGVLMFGDDRVRPYAYTYRDYVIRALNEDTPYDRFVHEQLAADLIEPKVEPWRLAAMGFLTLGRMFDNNIHDILDDRIDTVTRGLLGLTVACARCHDHKYDAVPTRDYYSLYGVFAGSEAPLELPLTEPADARPEYAAFEKEIAPKRRAVQQTLDEQYALLSETARRRVGDYLAHVAATEPDPLESAIYFLSLAPEDLRPPVVARWRRYLELHATPDDPVFGPWHDLMRLPEPDFAAQARPVVERWRARPVGVGPGQLNPLVRDALAAAPLGTKADVARAYGDLLKNIYEASKQSPPADDARRQLWEAVAGRDGPAYFPRSHTPHYMSRKEKDAFGGKVQELDRLAVKAAHAPPRAMVLFDAPEPHDPRVFVRGNPTRLGEKVPRQFLRVLAGEGRRPFPHGGGRLDLARAIAAPDNPLTARVLVNRVWMHHFGEPLVSTPGDFGARGSPPSHPELLDHLAWAFQHDCGWSLKGLHRLILLSNAYQQASLDRADGRKDDPENRLLWRANRRRLDLEAMRDSLLMIAGRLDRRQYGRPADVAGDPDNRRRTVYGLVDRQSLPGVFRAFDFASPDQSAERRPQTTVPQQALFGLNAPFVLGQAQALAARPEVARAPSDERRIAALYRLVFARAPDDEEVQNGLRFVRDVEARETAWRQYAQVLLLSNEFMFLD